MEEEGIESDRSELIDPNRPDKSDEEEEEQAKEERLKIWEEHSGAKHNLEEPDILFIGDDEWLCIWFENIKKEKKRSLWWGGMHVLSQLK